MVVVTSICSIWQTSLLTGIHYRNFKWGMERRLCFESHMDTTLWAFSDRFKKKDYISSDVKDLVVQYWTQKTCVSPNMKEVIKRRLTLKSWKSHATHLLLESQVCSFFISKIVYALGLVIPISKTIILQNCWKFHETFLKFIVNY